MKQRGAAMARQLMEEEKMARRIKRDLPRLTKMLNEKLIEWTDSHGEDFQYNGQIYFDVMDRQEEEWVEYKKNEAQLKLKKKQDYQRNEENHQWGKPKSGGKKLQRSTSRTRPFGESSRANSLNRHATATDKARQPLRRAASVARSRPYA